MTLTPNHRGRVGCGWRVDLTEWSQVAPEAQERFVRLATKEAAKKRHKLADETPVTSYVDGVLRMAWATVLDLEQASDEDLGITTWEFFSDGGPL